MLHHPVPNATLVLHTDASDLAVGAVLQQVVNNELQPLSFYSKKLTKAQRNYSTYDRELTAIFQSIKFFKTYLEGREFQIFTDHKPLVFVFQQNLDKASPRQLRQLDFISQFSTDIHHVIGEANRTADWLSRINSITTSKINFEELSEAQSKDEELQHIMQHPEKTSLIMKLLPISNSSTSLYCDTSQKVIRPWIPKLFHNVIIKKLHNISHPGQKATVKLVKKNYVWNKMESDIKRFVKNCIPCQKNKVHRHTISGSNFYVPPSQRLEHINIDIIGPLSPSKGYQYCLTDY